LADALWLALALALATPLWPNSTMLTSHTLALLCVTAAFALLWRQPDAPPPTGRRLLAAGALGGATVALEYMLAVTLLPLGLFALASAEPRDRWRRLALLTAGLAAIVWIPLLHHTLIFGHPLRTAHASLTQPRFAADIAAGFMGFVAPDLGRLYELTFGQIRGLFFLSPLLVGLIPGSLRLLRESRAVGALCVALTWGILLLVSALLFWHSGSAVGSRYALLVIPFAALPLATLLPDYRPWLLAGAAVGFALMLLATSVTALPPPPGNPPYDNVVRWLWERFASGRLASWQQPVLLIAGQGDGNPTLPYAFNLGQLLGLVGVWSLLPWAAVMVAAAAGFRRLLGRATPAARPASAPARR